MLMRKTCYTNNLCQIADDQKYSYVMSSIKRHTHRERGRIILAALVKMSFRHQKTNF